jgi:hypothetical protein
MDPTAAQSIRLIACPRPFSVERIDRHVPAGATVAGLMREAGMEPERVHARVFVDDVLVPESYWERVKPKAGHSLIVRVVPTGGQSGKDILRFVALIGVAATALFAPYVAAELGYATLAAGGGLTLGGASLTLGLGIVGDLGQLSLLPTRKEPR